MAVDLERARHLIVTRGLGFVCAMCEHYHNAYDKGAETCGKECGGPFAGNVFPHYQGALPDGNWTHFCFMCGCPNQLTGVVVAGRDRIMAVCSPHRKDMDKGLKPREEHHPLFPAPVLLVSGKVHDNAEDTPDS